MDVGKLVRAALHEERVEVELVPDLFFGGGGVRFIIVLMGESAEGRVVVCVGGGMGERTLCSSKTRREP